MTASLSAHGDATIAVENGRLVRDGEETLDVGDLDQNRHLKIRTFVRLGLRPLFQDLQARLAFRAMASDGVTVGQYYQDFQPVPSSFGYAASFRTRHQVTLARIKEQRRDTLKQRLVLETCAYLYAQAVTARAPAIGFDPPLGELVMAGRSRVLHVLTRPDAPRGARQVTEPPVQLAFLTPYVLDETLPTVADLERVDADMIGVAESGFDTWSGRWNVANSDVFQHVHAREYLFAMENRLGTLMADAALPLATFAPTRARVIFRSPSLVAERYQLRARLFQQQQHLVAIGSFHRERAGGADDRPAAVLRFEGRCTQLTSLADER